MKTKILYIAFLTLLSTLTAFAQTENELNKEVEVIKAYRPSISDAFKISFTPKIVDTTTFNPTFDYNLYVNPISTGKMINQLPSIGLQHQNKVKKGIGYIKGGFANHVTPYGEVYFNSSPSDQFDFGMFYKHLSSNPGITLGNELETKAPYSENQVRLFGKNLLGTSFLNWDLYYQRNAFSFYGFTSDSANYRALEATTNNLLNQKHVVNKTGINLSFNNFDGRNDLKQEHQLNYEYLWTGSNQQNHIGTYTDHFLYEKREFNIDVKGLLSYYLTQNINNTYNNNTSHQKIKAMITPSIVFDREIIDFSAGLNFGVVADDDTSAILHISPEVLFKFYPIKNSLTIFAGASGDVSANNYRDVLSLNPWINPNEDFRTTETPLKAFGGINARISKHLAFNFDIDYQMNQNDLLLVQTFNSLASPLFYNDFRAIYDDINILSIGSDIRFFGSDKFFMSLNGRYYKYYTANATSAWNRPDWEANLYLAYQITQRIKASSNLEVMGTRQWATYNNADITNHNTILFNTLDPYFNLSLKGEYEINQKFSAFIRADNLLNQSFEIMPGYNTHGLRIMLGATFHF